MKSFLIRTVFAVMALLPLHAFAQNSYTVCNDITVKADFVTLQGAIDSVSAGSMLYIFPSTTDYGNVTIRKKLFIVGTGFMLDQNSLPYSNPNTEGVSVSSMNLLKGSDNSYIEGLQLLGSTDPGSDYRHRFFLDSVSNVTINRCMTDVWGGFPADNTMFETRNTNNCVISQCYITQLGLTNINHSAGAFWLELGTGSQNLLFTNNIIDQRDATTAFYMNHNVNSAYLGNVTFSYNTFNIPLNNADFCNYNYFNNIFVNNDTSHAIVRANIRMNGAAAFNITNAPNLFAAGASNYQNANIGSMLAINTFGYHSFDQRWQVQDTSFAKHYSSTGGEAGAYGGTTPYVLSGIPALPNTYSITITKDSSAMGNILLHIKANAITN